MIKNSLKTSNLLVKYPQLKILISECMGSSLKPCYCGKYGENQTKSLPVFNIDAKILSRTDKKQLSKNQVKNSNNNNNNKKESGKRKNKKTNQNIYVFLTININFPFTIPLPNVKAWMFYVRNSFMRWISNIMLLYCFKYFLPFLMVNYQFLCIIGSYIFFKCFYFPYFIN